MAVRLAAKLAVRERPSDTGLTWVNDTLTTVILDRTGRMTLRPSAFRSDISFLEHHGETGQWTEAGVPAVAGYLSWLRNGRTVEHALAAPAGVPSAETLHARLAALISFFQWQETLQAPRSG